MKMRVLRWLGLCAAVLALGGCGVSQPFPDRRFYAIDAGAVTKDAQAPTARAVSLRVVPVRVVPPFDAVTFAYKMSPSEFKTDYYHGFAAPAGRLMTEQLIAWLDGSGAVKFAVGVGTRAHAMYTLEMTVTALYGDYTDPKKPQAVIETRVVVLDDDRGGTDILVNKMYRAREAVAGEGGPEKLAEAWSAAWRKMLGEISADMAKLPEEKAAGEKRQD